MKRILLILSILLFALPAIADEPTNPTYYQPGATVDNGCGEEILGDNPNSTEVNMVAQYTPICGAGQYSDTSNNPNGVCTACSGTGKYCPGMTAEEVEANLDSVTGLPKGNLGIIDCPVGYTDAGANENSTTIYTCQKQVTKSMCDTEANNFRNGTMAVADYPDRDSNKTWPLMVNYRDVDNHCYDYLECDSGYTKKNVYEWILENPQSITSYYGCAVGATSCSGDVKPGTQVFTVDTSVAGRPMNQLTAVSVCSDLTASVVVSNNATDYASLNGQSVGANCYSRIIDFPDQPWVKTYPFADAESCALYCGQHNITAYPLVEKNTDGRLLVKDTNNDVYAVVNGQFVLQTQNGNSYQDAQNATPLNDIGTYEYVPAVYGSNQADIVALLTLLAQLGQTADVNYNDADDDPTNDNPVKVCVPRDVTVTWVGVAEPDNETTCTYNSDMAVPTAEQTPQMNGYTFVGWTVGPVAAPSNNSNENNGSESENNGG